MQKVDNITSRNMVDEWDLLAKTRYSQITSGSDLTFNLVMLPIFEQRAKQLKPKRILDVGCGVGHLTDRLSQIAPTVGIDPSRNSINIAKSNFTGPSFRRTSVETFSRSDEKFDLICANMVAMDTVSISRFFRAVASLCDPSSIFIFSITHPCFWPRYYGYEHEGWFDYNSEIFVRSPFIISKDQTGQFSSTHAHRPLSMYSSVLADNGFSVSSILEPFPEDDIQRQYSDPWKFPRYCVFIAEKRQTD